MKKPLVSLIVLFSIFTSIAMSQTLQTVPYVDLNKYAGKWFEIASFPQRFQKGCNCTTAEYTVTDKGYVTVETSAIKIASTENNLTSKAKLLLKKTAVMQN